MTRTQALMRPWWKPIVWWSGMTLGTALLNTYLPELDRGWTFVAELRHSAILATLILVVVVIGNVIQDGWDRRKKGTDAADAPAREDAAPPTTS